MTNGEKLREVFPDIKMWGESKDTLDYCLGGMVHRVMKSFWNAEYKEPNSWIPVSERLPEKSMRCLVVSGRFNFIEIATYSDLMETIDHKIFYQGEVGHNDFVNITPYVKAWMPLPEPYKAESEAEE